MNKYSKNNERGFAALIALMVMAMLTILGLGALSTSDDEVSIAGNELQEMRAFYAAEGGLEAAAAKIQTVFDSTGTAPTTLPAGKQILNGCEVTFSSADNGPAAQKLLSTGYLSGLRALVKSFDLTSTAVSQTDQSQVALSVTYQSALVPIFQFAVFYENDLQATPQPMMTLNGRVHSNGNVHLQAFTGLDIESYLTSAGSIHHGLIFGQYSGTATADVRIKDASGAYQPMDQGGTWIDASHPDWYNQAGSIWGGKVQDQAFGVERLNLPITDANNPYLMLDPAAGNTDSYENKATIKFIEQKAFRNVGGIWSDVTVDMVANGVITFSADKFYDDREDVWVDVMELDIDKLSSVGYWPNNGVLYFNDKPAAGYWPAVRLTNGQELEGPLTIASSNPVYTLGDYNSTNKKPAAIMTDALTMLSNNWNDANSNLGKSSRAANNTDINICFITGDVDPSAGSYGGGLENLPRFLETWNPAVLKLRGSFICLWRSKQADSDWSISYYEPPVRDWAYDTDLDDPANHPPATPNARVFQRTGWKQEYITFAPTVDSII